MTFLKSYFRKLQEILKEKSILHFVLLIVSVAYLSRYNVWVVKYLGILFVSTFIFQSLFLLKKSYGFYIFRVLIFFLICFELIGIYGGRNVPEIKVVWNPEEIRGLTKDTVLGFKNTSNVQVEHILLENKDTLFRTKYTTDSLGRRISDLSIINDLDSFENVNNKHAVFLGGSYTFGFGIPYSSTFPFLYTEMKPGYVSYNYGVSGFSTHQIPLLFDDGINIINNDAVPEEDGFALYTFIDAHLSRVFGSGNYFSWAPCSTPDVYIENGVLVKKRFPVWKLLFFNFLNESKGVRSFNIVYTYPRTEEYYKRFAEIINYTARKYWEMKPRGNFYVGLFPGRTWDQTWIKYLDPRIKVLDIPQPVDYEERKSEYLIKESHHPDILLNTYYIENVIQLIE